MRIERAEKVAEKLRKLKEKSRHENDVSVVVGYTANYSLYVHEMVDEQGNPRTGQGIPRRKPHKGMYWDPQGRGQSKFLEQPFRENRDKLYQDILNMVKGGGKLVDGLLVAGLQLQRLSQNLVPVDTGNLKASAFTRQE